MSTINLAHNQLITCNLCQRSYNIDVYKRHINENQCIKRNHHRLPFESIKQRSIQIGDKIFSVQQQLKEKTKEIPLSNNRENGKQQTFTNSKKLYAEKIQKTLPSINHRRTLEQAKQLLERRTKYKPPLSQNINHFPSKLNRTNTITLPSKDLFHNTTKTSSQKTSYSKNELSSPPTTKFKNDNVPIKNHLSNEVSILISDRRVENLSVVKQPILTHSPKIPSSHTSTTQSNCIDQTDSACRSTRKVSTWTRPLQQTSVRNIISPIHIPTFQDSSCGPSHDHILLPFNSNYDDDDDDDEFERYSPTPPSTPKFQSDRTIHIKQNSIIDKQPTIIRPITYQKAKRQPNNESQYFYIIYTRIFPLILVQKYSHSNTRTSKLVQSTFHLPPINPLSYSKLNRHRTINLTPWR
ncbi:hypothetical protein I4U23_029332 [Adineta vaga]|nr:hypothetical protein I4U23_029332 [Adineta vaga]